MANKCVVRNAQYRRGGLSVRQRHNERQNADYTNDDIVKERAEYNTHFKQAQGSYEQMFNALLEAKTISTRGLGKDPFIVDELVFDVNSAYFENNGGYEYAKSFFEEAYHCAVKEIGGEQYVLSAVMHADERNRALSEQLGFDVFHYHLHVVYVPVVDKEIYFKKNNKDPELAGKLREVIKQVSHSKKWPKLKQLDDSGEVKRNDKGKAILVNAYSLLQDHFHDHMKEAGYTDFERGERGSTAEHLTVLEYKTQQETERAAAMTAVVEQKQEAAAVIDRKTDKKKQQLDALEKQTAVVKGEAATFDEIDKMGGKKTITGNISLSPAEWKTVSGLAKEGVKSRGIIAELKKRITDFIKKIAGLEKKVEEYEGKKESVLEQIDYYRARERAPKRMAAAIADIMRNPPEHQEPQRSTPQRKRSQGLEI